MQKIPSRLFYELWKSNATRRDNSEYRRHATDPFLLSRKHSKTKMKKGCLADITLVVHDTSRALTTVPMY